MRGKIVIDGGKKALTKKGYPIRISLTQEGKRKFIQTKYHTFKEHWDKDNALPLKNHPDYYNLLDYLQIKKLELRKVIAESKIRYMHLEEAVKILNNKSTGIFYDDAFILIKDLKRPYKVPLNSFNKYYPNYPYEAITKQTATDYMNTLIKTPVNGKPRSMNGVLSYMDSLTAIWNKLGKKNNPFSGVKPRAVPTKSKTLTEADLISMRDNMHLLKDKHLSIGSQVKYIKYLMLCFYLGGIDLVDLKNMRYDKHVVNGRIEFVRAKGGTNVQVNNIIPEQAKELLKDFDCKPYLVPLFKLNNYDGFIPNISRDLHKIQSILGLSKKPYSKSPRYTFINRAQNMLIDERCTKAIVGHSQKTTHSIYKDEFPQHIKDEAHLKIISF